MCKVRITSVLGVMPAERVGSCGNLCSSCTIGRQVRLIREVRGVAALLGRTEEAAMAEMIDAGFYPMFARGVFGLPPSLLPEVNAA